MKFTPAVLLGVVLLGGAIGVAQTVIRVAPPPPVRVGVVGSRAHHLAMSG